MVFWVLTPCNFANGYQYFQEKSDLSYHSSSETFITTSNPSSVLQSQRWRVFYFHMLECDSRRGFGLDIGFIDDFNTTCNYT
jgi:hypothetical protein